MIWEKPAKNDTEIYAVQVDFTLGPEEFARGYSLLPEIRKAKVEFYAYRREKIIALAAGLLMRRCLEQRLGRPLLEGELSVDGYGKPYLRGKNGVYFNISHAGAYVVCAVAGQETGVDIEEVKVGDCSEVARLVFSPSDYACWQARPDEERLDQFYCLWTLRESFSKAVGLGFGLAASEVSFSHADGGRDIYKANFSRGTRNEVWYCRHYHCFNDYKLALCLQEGLFPDRVNMTSMRDLYYALRKKK